VFLLLKVMSEQATALIDSTPDQIATAGASASFDEAFTLHHRAVFRAACAVLRDSALAEDVTQEVFLRLYRGFDAKPDGELLRPWLLRVTINLARNAVRGQNRSLARDTAYEKDAHGTGWIAPEKNYERRLDLEQARRALDRIKEPMRSCLLLKQQGLSYREISQTLSIRETSVGSLVARGRKEFAKVYGKVGGSR
jgi:RNA polymerase sigma factor (sigma-70 family)